MKHNQKQNRKEETVQNPCKNENEYWFIYSLVNNRIKIIEMLC